jgi:hypothetical protein
MNVWQTIVAVGIGGFGLGMGLMVGTFFTRTLWRYVKRETTPRDELDNGREIP